MNQKHFKISLLLITAVILTLGLSISFQSLLAAWTAPLANPATCNTGDPGCDEPLNTGPLIQTKSGALWINTNGISPLGLIVENGKVGIGTTAPNVNLEVFDSSDPDIAIVGGAGNTGELLFGDDVFYAAGRISYNHTDNSFHFLQASIEKVTFASGGNVGIGTTTPSAKLTIGGTPGVDGIKFPDGTLQTTAYINDINDNPRWIVWMDETNDKRTDPSIFTKSSQSVWSSYGELYFFINDFAQYSTLFEMKVYAPVATSITQKLYFLDDAIYCWLNGAMVYSNKNNGRRNDLITWQLVPGINTLQIVINNSGGDRYAAFVSGDFFYRYPTLRYVAP
ncbi:MAG: hypothetical protein WC349_03620 [Patescibacteria group bacterium]|jgi:hypothetical protein